MQQQILVNMISSSIWWTTMSMKYDLWSRTEINVISIFALSSFIKTVEGSRPCKKVSKKSRKNHKQKSQPTPDTRGREKVTQINVCIPKTNVRQSQRPAPSYVYILFCSPQFPSCFVKASHFMSVRSLGVWHPIDWSDCYSSLNTRAALYIKRPYFISVQEKVFVCLWWGFTALSTAKVMSSRPVTH